jgi:hypothetical protein
MAELTIEALRKGGQEFMEAVSREYYLAHAGLKADAELQPIYERFRGLLGRDALDVVLDAFRGSAEGSEERRSARTLLEWQVESQAGRATAALDEREIAWEGTANVVLPDGRSVPYAGVSIAIANAADRRERLLLEAARARLVERELAPIRRERLQRERDFVESLGVADGYLASFEATSGIALEPLAEQCRRFLADTEAMWDDVLPRFARRALAVPVAELTRADALALMRGRDYDGFFPARDMETAVRRQTSEMGLDPDAGGRVVYDLGERKGRRARAFCAPVRVPEEVYLVLRPHGGQSDWSTLLHELGHALHFAYMRPDLPFEFRWVGDNSVTEGYAMLFDHRMQDAGWLRRYTGLGGADVTPFLRHSALEELHFLRRYCAKLIYEVELYGGRAAWDSLPDLYVETLSAATTFRYDRADAFVDVDQRFYSARYLRAWQLQALLAESLVERFDEDWWRNPRAGPWTVSELFAEGQRELGDELAQRVSGRSLSFGPVTRAIETRLA